MRLAYHGVVQKLRGLAKSPQGYQIVGEIHFDPRTALRLVRPFRGAHEGEIVRRRRSSLGGGARLQVDHQMLEHVGKREASDRRKDALLRAAGWEVVRVRTGGLEPLGPHDVVLRTAGTKTVPAIIDALRGIRGDLVVDAYRR